MSIPLHILFIEDFEANIQLLLHKICQGGYAPIYQRVDSAVMLQLALQQHQWDIIICNHFLVKFSAFEALQLLKSAKVGLPVIVVSEIAGEDAAVEMMRAGASDYLSKGHLERLVPAIMRELREAHLRQTQLPTPARESHVQRMKDELIAIVNHELRTPLTSLQGSIELLLTGKLGELSEQGQRMLEIAANNIERLTQLTDSLLTLEQFDSGKAVLLKQPCNTGDLVKQAIENVQTIAAKRGVRLLATPDPIPVWLDIDRMGQVLHQLLMNAIRFSEPGGRIWLEVELKESGFHGMQPPFVLVSVKDEGQGIPADKLEVIFDRFQQVDASDTRRQSGAGLGLALCRRIVEQHQGNLWVESTIGQGSTFYLALPMQRVAVQT